MQNDDLKSKSTSAGESTTQQTRAGGPDTIRSADTKSTDAGALQDGLRAGGPDTIRGANPTVRQSTQEAFRHPVQDNASVKNGDE
jgi:hypothetical protein